MKKTLLLSLLAIVAFSGCNKKNSNSNSKFASSNTYRIALDNKIGSLDPISVTDVYASEVIGMLAEPLYEYNFLKKNLELSPLLAESLPKWSKNKKTFTIKLKKGIHFRDDICFKSTNGKGREVNARDIEYVFKRASDPKSVSRLYAGLETTFEGIKEFRQGKADHISGIKVIDDQTIEFKLVKPLPRVEHLFSSVDTVIVPKECVEHYGDQFRTNLVGTGAFFIKEVDLGSKIILEKNPNYHAMTYPKGPNYEGVISADVGKPLPLVDRIEIQILIEAQPRWLNFLSRAIDVLAVPKDSINSALPNGGLSEELKSKGVVHIKQAKGDVTTLIFNLKSPVWGKDKRLRQAVALAVDVDKFIEIQYANQAIHAQSLLDPNMYGYEIGFKSKWSKRDLVRAKDLLAKAGYPEGKGLPPLRYPTNQGATSRQFDELLQRQLKEIGVTVQSEPLHWPVFIEKVHKRDFDLVGMGYSSSVPDPEEIIGLYHSKYIQSDQNVSAYQSVEMDRLLDSLEELENGPKRIEVIKKILEIADEDLPMVPMVHRIANHLIQPWVKNYRYAEPAIKGIWTKYVGIDVQK